MSGGGQDDHAGIKALFWIETVGKPLEQDVEKLKQALWTVGGGGIVLGVLGGLATPYIGPLVQKLFGS